MEENTQLDCFMAEVKLFVENDEIDQQTIDSLYEKYPEVKVSIRRAMFVVEKQIRTERRNAFYATGIPYEKDWPWFAFDEKGIVDTSSGEKYQVKKVDGEYQVIKL